MTIQFHHILSDIADEYEGFIVDLWGVIHDGQATYPGVIETLQKLKARDKKVLFLSNAPRRSFKAAKVLEDLGVGEELYDHVLTSGEATYDYIDAHPELGAKYFYIGPEKDQDILDGLEREEVSAGEADFALVTGFNDFGSTMEEKEPEITAALEQHLPLICANPDFEVVRQNGQRMLCAGLIAKEYEKRGGEVTYFGKPYPAVYKKSLELLGLADVSKLCAVGDNLDTDIAGAQGLGIYAVLCAGGILAERLGITPGELPSQENVQALCEQEGVTPNGVIAAFRW